jgi:hypothetical protein
VPPGCRWPGALVVTEDDDVGNLHAALAAQELNPALRLRLRMFNRELGRRVQELFPDCQVFDSAGLAVPAFVAAALLQDWQQRVEVDGRTLVVRQAAVTEPDVLLSLARVHPDGTADLFPDTDEQVLCLAEAPPTRRARRPERLAMEPPGRLAAAWTVVLGADVRLRVMAAIVLGLTVTGIAIFWWFSEQDLDLIDAIYFTVTIMTTTGFGDIHLRNAPPALQLYGVALMLSGTAALAILFALITDALISARLARVLGATIPRGLHDHVVVCGLGNIGYRMVEQLHDLGVPVVEAELHESNPLPAGRAPPGRPGAGGRHPPARDAGGPARPPGTLGGGRPGLHRRHGRRARAGHGRGRGAGAGRDPPPRRARLPGRGPDRWRAGAGRRQPVLLLSDAQGSRWRPEPSTLLRGGTELVGVVPSGELGRVLAWTGTGAHAGRQQRPWPRVASGPCIMGALAWADQSEGRDCWREDRVLGDLGVVDPERGHRRDGAAALRAGHGPLRPAAP